MIPDGQGSISTLLLEFRVPNRTFLYYRLISKTFSED